MPLNYRLLTPPVTEPVTLTQAKLQLRVDFTDDDTLITAMISAARQMIEQRLQIAIYNQTWVLYRDYFPYGDYRSTVPMDQRSPWNFSAYWSDMAIRLPRPRCVSVTGITYLDPTGTQQTLNPLYYFSDTTSLPARIVPGPGLMWPTTQFYQPGSVQVTYVAGSYGDGVEIDTCPQSIKMAILLLVGHLYENREASADKALTLIPLGVDALAGPYAFLGGF